MKARNLFYTLVVLVSFLTVGCWELPLQILVSKPEAEPAEVPPVGKLSVVLDSSSPSSQLVTAGSLDVPATKLRFSAAYESIFLQRLGVRFDGSNVGAVIKYTVWDGTVKVGEGVFGVDRFAVSTFPNPVLVPKDGVKILTLMVDIASIGVMGSAKSGDSIALNYDLANPMPEHTYGIGAVSGSLIYPEPGEKTQAAPVRVLRSVPKVEKLALSAHVLVNAAGVPLYRFKISAPAGTNGISLYKFTFSVALSDPARIKLSNFRLYYYTDAGFSIPAGSATETGGLLNSGKSPPNGLGASITGCSDVGSINVGVLFNPTNPTSSTPEVIVVPAGETRYFELRADVSELAPQSSVVVRLLGDSEFVSPISARDIDERGLGNLIWSDNPFSTFASVNDPVWLNGFLIPNLPPSGLEPEILTAPW